MYRYGLDNLKFGKIDIGRYREAAEKFGISDASTSKQLPTLMLFKNGEEVMRRPCADTRGKIARFFFTAVSTYRSFIMKIFRKDFLIRCYFLQDNIKTVFDLNNIYKNALSKSKPIKAPKDDEKKKSD